MSFFQRDAQMGTAAQAASRRLRLLLVDENATARAVIARRLSHRHYDVTAVDDGFAAQKALMTRPSDIILIDMDLRLLPAIATMEKIRAAHPVGHVCIVMIDGAGDSARMIAALDAGADDHIVKPFDFDMLHARLRRVHARADRMALLSRQYAELDARIARRAMELGETREALRQVELERARLMVSVDQLQAEVARLSAR
ncbi:response regulator transcription factor [Sphingobium abikonense]|uniref:response regulator transcription factor n=1 Tax=Sphingobium abikonense TaxID=86193 RepID=UPI0035182318